MEDKKQPIVIKKIIQGHGHHGGSWKVAFADFATAMMAFFMVLWLVGQTDAQKRGGIAEYFQNPSMVRGHSEAPTGSLGPGGAGMSLISFGTSIEPQKADETAIDKIRDGGMAYVSYDKLKEQQRLEKLIEELREEIGSSPELAPYEDQMLMEIMSNGLRIQIIDKQDRPMFDRGSANLKPYTQDILYELAKTINNVPNKITISGHTDASPMTRKRGSYTNWELSSDRANSARRALIEGGLKAEKIVRVIGLASTVLFDKENPLSPTNRRISIVVMKREVSDMAQKENETKAIPKQLLQQSRGIDDFKNNTGNPLSEDELELLDDNYKRAVRSGSDTGLGLEMQLHGIQNKDKKTSGKNRQQQDDLEQSLKDSSSKRDPGALDREVIVRDRGSAKSFIELPPIIDPALLPRNKQ